MMFDLKKSMILLIGCIFILMCASCAFAADLNQSCNFEEVDNNEMNLAVENEFSDVDAFENDNLETSQLGLDNTYNVTENIEETESSPDVVPASYDDLCHDIENLKPGDNYDIKKDYVIEDCAEDLSKNRIININADNVVIDGNGHTIDANGNKGYFAVFNVVGNNVTIMNLNIINSRIYNYDYSTSYWNRYGNEYNRVLSPIEWRGNKGSLLNCVFDDNVGEDGGAIYWAGSNGLIYNCFFNNNAAVRGGSIFMCGYNNTIRNSIIKDSYSNYLEGIFLKNFDENGELLELYMNNCTIENSMNFVDDFHVEGSCAIISDNRQIFPVIPAGSYNELREIIRNLKDGDIYTLTKDYYFDYTCFYYPIMANNVTINGNGHKIYGSDVFANSLIWVTGNNVTVTNLNFEFNDLKDGFYGASFVNWKGNNGVLENCTFIGNHANYGGAIIWQGNEGFIDNCAFINNTAYVSAGAIFISGENNRIANSIFLNSNSRLSGEAIFIDSKRKNLTLENVFFNNETTLIFDAGKMNCNINVAGVMYSYYSSIGNEQILLNELIYQSIIKGSITYLNDQISYYSSYYAESGDFVFTITKDYNQHDVSYVQEYHFKDIFNNTFSDIFTKLRNNDFETKITLTKTAYISDESDYNNMLNEFYAMKSFIPIQGDLDMDTNFIGKTLVTPFTHALNVVFNKALTISCDSVWDMNESPYDMLLIDGAGSTIKASFEDREEDKWVVLSENNVFYAHNITLKGFNTVIENMGGQCLLDHVNFNNNKMDYIIDRDWGAAILNTGIITCINCSFTDNYAKNGGAIFNQGLLTAIDCIFAGNEAYGDGNDICVGDGGQVIINNETITSNGQSGYVYIAESMSLTESTLITVFSVTVSFIVGAAVGFLTANPVAGLAVGALVGAAIGSACAAWIISEKYDVNYDRLKTVLTLVIGSAVTGAFGGFVGGYVGSELAANAAWVEAHGGPGIASVDSGFRWYHAVYGLLIGGVIPGGIVGISHYCTN